MKRYLVLLPMLFLGTVMFAEPRLKPGALAEFNPELPRELRLVAGHGQLPPVAHARVTIAAPADLDTTRDWAVMVVSGTSDRPYHSSRRLLAAYADTARKEGWILVAADPMEDVAVENNHTLLRFALPGFRESAARRTVATPYGGLFSANSSSARSRRQVWWLG